MPPPEQETAVPQQGLPRELAGLTTQLHETDSVGQFLKAGLLKTIETEIRGRDPESLRHTLERVRRQLRSIEQVIEGTLDELRPPSNPFLPTVVEQHIRPPELVAEVAAVAARDGAHAGAIERLRHVVEAIGASDLDRAIEIAELTEHLGEGDRECADLRFGLLALKERRVVDALATLGPLRQAQSELRPRLRVTLELLWARLLSESGANPARIQCHLNRAEAIDPHDGRTLAASSRYCLDRGETDEAVLAARQAVDAAASAPDGFTALGVWALRQGDDSGAQEFFRQAVDRALQTLHPRRALSNVLSRAPVGVLVELARRRASAGPEAALRDIDEALEDTSASSVATGEAYALKAQLLAQIGRSREDVTDAHRSAADWFRSARLYEAAEEQLELALAVDPEDAYLYWDRAETVRLRSEMEQTPGSIAAAKADELRLSGLAIWEHGTSQRHPLEAEAWVYLTRGLLEADSGAGGDWQGEWRRVAFFESNLLLYETAEGWTFLTEVYETLGLRSCALQAAATGFRLRPDDEAVASAYVTSLANLGRFDEEFRNATDMLPEDSWKHAVEAVALEYVGRPEEALLKLEGLEEHALLWQLQCRARCRRAVRDPSGADEDNLRILNHPEVQAETKDDAKGAAYYRLGRFDEARAALAPLRDDPSLGGDAQSYVALCDLSEGHIVEGARELIDGVSRITSLIDLEILNRYELPALKTKAAPAVRAELGALLEDVGVAIVRKREELRNVPEPEEEIRRVLTGVTDPEDARLLGANATLARLLRHSERAREAASVYDELASHGFPEAATGRRRCAQVLVDEGDDLVRAGSPHDALARYEAAETIDGDADGTFAGRRAYAQWASDGGHANTSEFLSALEALATAGDPDPPDTLAQTCRGLLTGTAGFWSLRDAWTLTADDPERAESVRRAFRAACEALDPYLDDHLGLGWSPSDERVPVVLPIAVEIGLDFIPAPDDELPLVGLMDEMQDRTRAHFGIVVPGVHFRPGAEPMPPDAYVMLIHEARVEGGRAPVDRVLAAASKERLVELGIPPPAIEPPPGMTVSPPGCLVAREYLPQLTNAGIEVVEDRFRQISAHIESLVAANLEAFFSLAALDELADAWSEQSSRLAEIVEDNLIDGRTRVRLSALLRMLLAEQVPLTRPDLILGAAHDWLLSDDRSLTGVLRATRLAVAWLLPGSDTAVRRWNVPPEMEARLAGQADDTVESLTAQFELLTQLREAVSQDGRLAAVATSDDQLRQLIRRLIRDEFPLLPVLTATELAAASRMEEDASQADVSGGAAAAVSAADPEEAAGPSRRALAASPADTASAMFGA